MITAVFKDENAFATVSEDVWQWDYGQKLRIEGLTCIDGATEVDFSTSPQYGSAISMVGTIVDDGLEVNIPDEVLAVDKREDYNVYAFTFQVSDSSGETTHRVRIPVKARPKRTTYEGTTTDDPFGTVIEEVNKAAEIASTAANQAQDAWAAIQNSLVGLTSLYVTKVDGVTTIIATAADGEEHTCVIEDGKVGYEYDEENMRVILKRAED